MLTEPQCHLRPCAVIGSAPDIYTSVIRSLSLDTIIMCANGGAKIAHDTGRDINVLATTTHLYRHGQILESEISTQLQMKGVITNTLWIDTTSNSQALPSVYRSIKHILSQTINKRQRDEIVKKACGQPLRVSTGVFLVCLANVSGATKISLIGISPGVDGHFGMDHVSPRDHVDEDAQCLNMVGLC